MTAKEKAEELVHIFNDELFHKGHPMSLEIVKNCALICVKEIIESNPTHPYNGGFYETVADRIEDVVMFYNDVKTEINNL